MTRAEAEDLVGEEMAPEFMRLANSGRTSRNKVPPPEVKPKNWSYPALVDLITSWFKTHGVSYSIRELPPGIPEETWSNLRFDLGASHILGQTVIYLAPPTRKESKGV